ncbi:MAG: hypothetical protein WCF67_17380 [Chitinophagaceae bacterium]
MATLQISRESEYANRFRKINIILDGKKVGELANGESKDFEITEGVHTLHATIDWCGSNPVSFTIADQEKKTIGLTSFAKHNPIGIFAAFYYILFATKKYLHLRMQ